MLYYVAKHTYLYIPLVDIENSKNSHIDFDFTISSNRVLKYCIVFKLISNYIAYVYLIPEARAVRKPLKRVVPDNQQLNQIYRCEYCIRIVRTARI